ncbi:MAG: sterol desaturase family protein [Acidimicrobiia bacterium]|nr:sterol desaturase family protein [Acidimicrobiia bacterium]
MLLLIGLAGGLAAWSLVEYLAHRFSMHRPVVRFDPIAREHRRHHRDPLATDLRLRLIGHGAGYALGAVIGLALAFVMAAPVAYGVGFGLAAGYSTYELVHWCSHHRPARTRYGVALRRRHDAHHHGHPGANYGVSTAVWDRVFGTVAPIGSIRDRRPARP